MHTPMLKSYYNKRTNLVTLNFRKQKQFFPQIQNLKRTKNSQILKVEISQCQKIASANGYSRSRRS